MVWILEYWITPNGNGEWIPWWNEPRTLGALMYCARHLMENCYTIQLRNVETNAILPGDLL